MRLENGKLVGYAKIRKLREDAIIPARGSSLAAGYDLYSCTDGDIQIAPGNMVKVGTGISITPPEGFFGAIFARSGMATKQGLRPANCVGKRQKIYKNSWTN